MTRRLTSLNPATEAMAHRPTILVVDDEPDILDLLDACLKKSFHVRRANNGEEALDIISACKVDCLVSDFSMKGVTGGDLVAAVRARDVSVKTVNHSAYDQRDLYADCDLWIQKPTEFSKIAAMISELLGPNDDDPLDP